MKNLEIADQISALFDRCGSSQYGGEAVTQLEHAVQAATLAEADGADANLIAAALLHDIGHLLHELPNDSPDEGIDDVHERLAYHWLRHHFGPAVTEPIRLHVDAKRYLCAVDPTYKASLSAPSALSLTLQGGPFNDEQAREFETRPHFEAGVRLRRWDDLAKVAGLSTPPIDHFIKYVEQVQLVSAVSK